MSEQLPIDASVRAEYQDGFILDETEQNDTTLYPDVVSEDSPGNNTFADILQKRPEEEHGPLIKFTVFYKDRRYDIDWTTLPESARPIRYKNRQFVTDMSTGEQWAETVGCGFGYQYTDSEGKNVKEVQEL